MVTFGTVDRATRWLEETQCPYDMLLDPDRQVGTFDCNYSKVC